MNTVQQGGKRNLFIILSRHALNIEGFGDRIIEDFYNLGFIKTYEDFYTLDNHKEDLMELEGYGSKKVK